MVGSSISRFAWSDLIARARPNYTVDALDILEWESGW